MCLLLWHLSMHPEVDYTGWKVHVSCGNMLGKKLSYQESAAMHSCKSSTTEPIFSDLSQLDDLQAVVFQFEVVVTLKEVAVIWERQT